MTNKMTREIDESSLTRVSTLGHGSFGSVALMKDLNFQLYAEKSSPLSHMKNLQKELRIMTRFRDDPRIVQASSPNFHIRFNPERCYIFMEYASKGTLHNMISKFRGRRMPEKLIGRVALMIIQGLYTLHSHGYVHCDIKPSNILFFPSTTYGELWELKLADFGLSKEPCTDSRSLVPGTKQYMPPESIGYDGVMGSSVDVWSLGCIVIQMFGGYPEDMGDCYTWRLSKPVSPVARDFLSRCMALLSSRRATALELLGHPFVSQRVISVPPRQEMLTFPSFLRSHVMA